MERFRLMRELALLRYPPGDRWKDALNETDEVFISLTDGLQYVFETAGVTEFHISAKDGKVFKVLPDPPKEPEKPKSYSLYDEDY